MTAVLIGVNAILFIEISLEKTLESLAVTSLIRQPNFRGYKRNYPYLPRHFSVTADETTPFSRDSVKLPIFICLAVGCLRLLRVAIKLNLKSAIFFRNP